MLFNQLQAAILQKLHKGSRIRAYISACCSPPVKSRRKEEKDADSSFVEKDPGT
jgi:hypothetical protein